MEKIIHPAVFAAMVAVGHIYGMMLITYAALAIMLVAAGGMLISFAGLYAGRQLIDGKLEGVEHRDIDASQVEATLNLIPAEVTWTKSLPHLAPICAAFYFGHWLAGGMLTAGVVATMATPALRNKP